jgi:hypothetical protein
MPRPTIEYMNARRAAKPASGGAKQSRRVQYAPDSEADPADAAAALARNRTLLKSDCQRKDHNL